MGLAKTKLKGLWDEMLGVAGDGHHDRKIHVKEWVAVLKGHTPKDQAHWYLDYCTFIFKVRLSSLRSLRSLTFVPIAHPRKERLRIVLRLRNFVSSAVVC